MDINNLGSGGGNICKYLYDEVMFLSSLLKILSLLSVNMNASFLLSEIKEVISF